MSADEEPQQPVVESAEEETANTNVESAGEETVNTNVESAKEETVNANVDSAKEENANTNGTVITEDLNDKIIKQIEYYFGNYNLPRDKFLGEQTKLEDGWVSLDVMVKFKRLADLSTDHKVIRSALKKSDLMEVDDNKNKIRRSPTNPLPYFGEDLQAETVKRTIYCKGLPKDGSINLDILLEYFKPFGPYDTIHMRQFLDRQTKKHGFKGSILIVFPDEEKAKTFMDIDDVQYKGMPLLRKWQKDYLEEKASEVKERKARKEARLQQLEKEGANPTVSKLSEIEPIPRGGFVFATGFTNTTSREDIKASLLQFTDDVAFVDFSKGDTEGYIRFGTPYSNKDALETIDGQLKVNDAAISMRLVEGEEEDEQVKKAEAARTKVMTQSSRKRKSGGGRGGHYAKRRRY